MLNWLRALTSRIQGGGQQGDASTEAALLSFLTGQISVPKRAASVLGAVDAFRKRSPADRANELAGIYLLLEQYLTEVDPLHGFKRHQLRDVVRARFPELLASDRFSLIFEPLPRQELLLCRLFLKNVLSHALSVLGATGDNLLLSVRDWVSALPGDPQGPVPFDLGDTPSEADTDRTALLTHIAAALFEHLEQALGEGAGRFFERSYDTMTRRYSGLESFPVVVQLLPEKLLDDQKIQFLTRGRALKVAQTELSVARTAALESAAQLQAVLNTAGEGIITIDPSESIVLANREIEHVFGYAQDELIGRKLSSLFSIGPEDSPPTEAPDLQGGAGELLGHRLEWAGVRKDGTVFPVEIRVAETHIGDRLFYTAAVRDITERKHYESELMRARDHAEEMTRLKTAFLANMSHEIRTPLSSIMGFAQVLGEEVTDQQREFTQLIERSGQRLLETINSVLEFARVEAEGIVLSPGPVNLTARTQEAVERFRPLAEEKGLTLRVDVSGAPIQAELDADCLDRILGHLIGNAVKFTERGEVSVEASLNEAGIELRVRDTGIGINGAFLSQVFSEFKQESDGLARSHEGAGLGLAITKRLVHLMGGDIDVESQKGRGSTFIVRLPVTASRQLQRVTGPTANLGLVTSARM